MLRKNKKTNLEINEKYLRELNSVEMDISYYM